MWVAVERVRVEVGRDWAEQEMAQEEYVAAALEGRLEQVRLVAEEREGMEAVQQVQGRREAEVMVVAQEVANEVVAQMAGEGG